ncbi:glycosyltransferase [Lutibacter sp. TH_r2]|uniref:glycosyltransferase n=1 Tax=Lutibacter sp. TH_r2 TaxID=3082083 RepID=UPI002955A752|nr:glycosyltransferase [Lutibacter sp. TH_r2]MDV7185798.1 glycosyltransferase [Lutibacter sp. TH_r2]
MKKIVVSVYNDISTDQRVQKICNSLIDFGFEVFVIGRKKPLKNLDVDLNFKTHKFNLLFKKGFLSYAEFNTRLFFKLLFIKKDILLANDLDTLLPNFIVSKLFNKKLVYDSHELFTEMPELSNRPFVKSIWTTIEKLIFPKLKNVYTVNSKIASIYTNKYKVNVRVIRNIAKKYKPQIINSDFIKRIKGNNKMLILQGGGINIDRGAEEAIEMMQYLENTILYIIGSGEIFELIKQQVIELKLQEKVIIIDRIPYLELMKYTQISDLGLSLDKNTNLNYILSLPNKVFDYIQAETPILTSNTKVVSKLITENNIGYVSKTHNPKELANIVNDIFKNNEKYNQWKKNLETVRETFNWENESKVLKKIYQNLK